MIRECVHTLAYEKYHMNTSNVFKYALNLGQEKISLKVKII